MTRRVLYCWELGAGFGHVTRMNYITSLPAFTHSEFHFALRDIHKSAELSLCDGTNLYQAPRVDLNFAGYSPNYSHILRRCGWDKDETLFPLIHAWRNLISQVEPELVLIDHSPSAALAALTLGISFKNVGNGFEIPPVQDPMPSLDRFRAVKPAVLRQNDKVINQQLEKVSLAFNLDRSLTLAELFNPQNSLIVVHPLLDHYAGRRPTGWLYYPSTRDSRKGLSQPAITIDKGRSQVFFYLHSSTKNLVEALVPLAKRMQVYGYITGAITEQQSSILSRSGVVVLKEPAPIDFIMGNASFVISNGGVGLLNHCISAGVPTVLLPQHAEQNMLAESLVAKKIAITYGQHSKDIITLASYLVNNKEIMRERIATEMKTASAAAPFVSDEEVTGFFNS